MPLTKRRITGLPMVVSTNKGAPTWTPIYCSPYYGDTPKTFPNFGKPAYLVRVQISRLCEHFKDSRDSGGCLV